MIHELKCHPMPFNAARIEDKTFEFRKNDRDYNINDIIVLREYDPLTGYTGKNILRKITYILKEGFELTPGYCIFSIRPLTQEEEAQHRAGTIPAISQ